MILEHLNYLCDSGCLLSYRHIDTDTIFSLLVDDDICCDRSLSCLAIAYDKLTLTSSDREHRIDRKNTRLKRHGNRLAVYDARRIIFYRAIVISLDISLSVYRLSKGVYYPAYELFSNRNTGALAGSGHLCTLGNARVTSEKDDTHLICTDILYHSLDSVFEDNDLTVHRLVNTKNRGDTVTYRDDGSNLTLFGFKFKIFNLLFQYGDNVARISCAHLLYLPLSCLSNRLYVLSDSNHTLCHRHRVQILR